MLKVLAAVLAVLSAIISITIYTSMLPDVQKQAADNSATIEENAEAIQTLENIKLYEHHIKLYSNSIMIYLQIVSQTETYSADSLIEYFVNNGFTNQDNTIRASGRVYPPTVVSAVAVYGVYVSNNNFYSIYINTDNLLFTSTLLSNVSVEDNNVLLN